MTIKEELEFIKEFLKKIFGRKFNELSLYIMGLSILLIYFIDRSFNDQLHHYLETTEDGRVFIILFFMLLGIFYSLYHAFSKAKKTDWQKTWMLYFAMTLQFFVAMIALFRSIEVKEISVLFPLLNFFSVFISYQLFDNDVINEDDIDDNNASLIEIILATLILVGAVSVSYYLIKLHWIETLSISFLIANQVSNLSHRMTSYILNLKL